MPEWGLIERRQNRSENPINQAAATFSLKEVWVAVRPVQVPAFCSTRNDGRPGLAIGRAAAVFVIFLTYTPAACLASFPKRVFYDVQEEQDIVGEIVDSFCVFLA